MIMTDCKVTIMEEGIMATFPGLDYNPTFSFVNKIVSLFPSQFRIVENLSS